MKKNLKRTIIFMFLLVKTNFAFTQICVDSKSMYSSAGLNISYCTISQGSEGNCRKYKVTISISNTNSDYISLAGSSIYLFSGHDQFPAVGKCGLGTSYSDSSGDVNLAFPGQGLGFVTELKPNYNEKKSFIVYTDDNYPRVSFNITPNLMNIVKGKPKEKKNNSSSENNKNTTKNLNNNTENNSNNTSNTSSEKSSTFSSLIEKYNDLCNQASNLNTPTGNAAFSSNCNKETTMLESPNNISILKSRISNLENALKNSKTEDDKKEKAKQAEEDRLEKEAARKQKAEDDKREQYNTAIQNGDSAMNSKQFSSAMSYYSNAKSYAQTSSETAEADRKYKEAFEAKKTAERTERVAKVQADDVVKDAQYAGLTASFVGLAAFLKDSYSPKWYAMKFQLGLGLESFPLISNNVNKYHWDQTYIESFTVPTFHIGLKSGFFNNKGISLEINPQFNLGFSALSPGKSGGYLEYGSTGTLYFGKKGYSIFKVFVEGGYFKRSGTFNYDYDAANAKSDGTLTSNSDDVREGIFSHGKIKYGTGIMLRWINDEGKETFVRPAVYYEKASFFESDTKPVLNMNLQVNISSEIIIELTYVKNYYIPGEVKYPITLTKENMNFWGIKIIRQGKLF